MGTCQNPTDCPNPGKCRARRRCLQHDAKEKAKCPLDAAAGSLLPCPFCEGEAELKSGYGGCEFGACKSCGARSGKAWRGECLNPKDWPKIKAQRTQKAIELWNNRR